MYQTRPLIAPGSTLRLIQFAASNKVIPLQTENWSDRWCTLPDNFETVMKEILDLQVRSDDVFVVTYMKCGTTWMQETAWLLLHNLDYERASKSNIWDRSVFIDFSGLNEGVANTVEKCNQAPSPRLIKTHLPANLLPKQLWEKKQKTIYVARNAKDVVISSFHFMKGLGLWKGNLDEFVDEFINNKVLYTPFWAQIVDFWQMRNEPFIFFVTYEEMKRNLGQVVQRLCKFLGRAELTEADLQATLEHLSFEKMKENKNTNLTYLLKDELGGVNEKFQFMRRGIIGSYKDELPPELQRKIDNWSKEFLSKRGIQEEDIFGNI